MTTPYKFTNLLDTLNAGGTILYPTDTIWGIGCDATNEQAVERICYIKQLSEKEPFVVLVSSMDMLKEYVKEVAPRIETLLLYHQRPLTVIYEKAVNIATNVCTDQGAVAMRIVQDDFCKNLINTFGKPIIATAASLEKESMPGHFGQISSAILQTVDCIADYRRNDRTPAEPSVIAKLDNDPRGELIFLRE